MNQRGEHVQGVIVFRSSRILFLWCDSQQLRSWVDVAKRGDGECLRKRYLDNSVLGVGMWRRADDVDDETRPEEKRVDAVVLLLLFPTMTHTSAECLNT